MEKTKEDFKADYGVDERNYFDQFTDELGKDGQSGLLSATGGLVENIYGDITGRNSQIREFAQQEYLQEKQWNYDRPVNEMARMKEAGINPLLAAQGVAGGNQSTSAPSVASPTPSDPLGSMAGSLSNLAGASKQLVDADDIRATRALRIEKLGAEIASTLESAGFTKLQSMAMSIQIKYMDDKERASYLTMLANLDNIREDYKLKQQQVARFDRDMELLDADIANAKALKNEIDARTLQLQKDSLLKEKQAFEQQWNNDFMLNWNINPKNPIAQNFMTQATANGEQMGEIIFNYNKDVAKASKLGENDANIENGFQAMYELTSGEQRALVDNAFDLAYNKTQGELPAKLTHQEYQGWIDANREWVKSYTALLSHVSDDPVEIANQIALVAAWSIYQGSLNGANMPRKPEVKKPSVKNYQN